jgi:hypothetical protein
VSAAYEQAQMALRAQAEQQARLLEEKDRQIVELHALLRDALRRPMPALPAPAAGDSGRGRQGQKPWWLRWFGG